LGPIVKNVALRSLSGMQTQRKEERKKQTPNPEVFKKAALKEQVPSLRGALREKRPEK